MTLHRIPKTLRHALRAHGLLQIAVLIAVWRGGEAVVHLLHLPIPGGIVGMFAVLALLASGRLKLASLRIGAQWLLADMLLFFIPAMLAILDHREFIGILGLKLLAVIFVGAATVMIVTALAVDLSYRLMIRHGGKHELAP